MICSPEMGHSSRRCRSAAGATPSTSGACRHGSLGDTTLVKPTGKTPAKRKVAQALKCLQTERAKRAAKRATAKGGSCTGLPKPRPAKRQPKRLGQRSQAEAEDTEPRSPTPPPAEEEPRSPTPPPPYKGKGKGKGKSSKKAGMFLD